MWAACRKRPRADSGYFSAAAVTNEALSGVDLYVTPDRGKKTEEVAELVAKSPPDAELEQTVIEQMREKLKTNEGREVYKQRKLIVEPVFGQVKEVRGSAASPSAAWRKTKPEWDLICLWRETANRRLQFDCRL